MTMRALVIVAWFADLANEFAPLVLTALMLTLMVPSVGTDEVGPLLQPIYKNKNEVEAAHIFPENSFIVPPLEVSRTDADL
jgi:hypothetical protein